MSATKSINNEKLLLRQMKRQQRKEYRAKYLSSMKYAFHIITHPFDGYWDLVHEKRGTLGAATTYLALFLLTYVLKLFLTNFQFVAEPVQYVNALERIASLLLPFLILCLANWAMTTLFDGKGRFSDIYMAMCYALVPYILLQMPLIALSNIITYDEGSFYYVLLAVSIIWCVGLAFIGLMEVHDYGPGKTVLFLFVTVLGGCVIIFLMLIFFSLINDALGYFRAIYREIAYRLN